MEANDDFLNLVAEMDELRDLAEEADIQLAEVLQENEYLNDKVEYLNDKVEATEELYKMIREGNDPVNIKLRDKMLLLMSIIQEYEKPKISSTAVDHLKRKAGLII